jgi:hypothetical protein
MAWQRSCSTDRIAFTTVMGAATTAAFATTSAASAARSACHFGCGVAYIGQYLPPLLKEVHAPYSQLEADGEEAMMGGLWVLVVTVVWVVVVHAGCVCAASPCCFVRLACISVPKYLENHGILGIARKLSMRQTKLIYFTKANLYNLTRY